MFRSNDDFILTGVCGGIAEHFGIPSIVVRLAFASAFALFGTGLLLYAVLFFAMPASDK